MILCMSQCLGGSTGPAQQPIKKVIKETKPLYINQTEIL